MLSTNALSAGKAGAKAVEINKGKSTSKAHLYSYISNMLASNMYFGMASTSRKDKLQYICT